MGTWTLVWTGGGSALAPLLGGLVLAALGPQAMCAALIAIGAGGAVLYSVLRAKGPEPVARDAAAVDEHAEECAESAQTYRETAPAS
jgi:hypothetical protein